MHGSGLDLVLTNFPEFYSIVYKCDCDFDSDHTILNFTIETQSLHIYSPTRCIFSFKRADYDAIRRDLSECNLNHIVNGCSRVDEACSLWTSQVNAIIQKNVPQIIVRNHRRLPWFDSHVCKLRKNKIRAWRSLKCKNKSSRHRKYKKIRNEYNNVLHSKYKRVIFSAGTCC